VFAALSCEDLGIPTPTVTEADLLVLAQEAGAPAPAAAGFWVANGTARVRALRHPDAFNTLYLELSFPAGSLADLDGDPLGPEDSVWVTIEPLAGAYGLTLSPAGLTFAAGARPTARFAFARYADPSVADGEPAFADRDAYLTALDLWREVGIDRWEVAAGSGSAGVDQIAAALDAGGRYWLAAVR
jgi:hypothetical protein